MPLIRNGKLTDNPWTHLTDDEPAPAGADVTVSLERWQAEREALAGHAGRLGLRLRPDQPPHLIADDLSHFALIALDFPAFKDGRAYSHARLLRERYGFRGELRATGDVLRDQLLFMVRCGFDSFEVDDRISTEVWNEALCEFTVFYQPTGDDRAPAWNLRRGVKTAAE